MCECAQHIIRLTNGRDPTCPGKRAEPINVQIWRTASHRLFIMTWAGAEVGVWVAALPLHWSNLVNAFVEKKKKNIFQVWSQKRKS